MSEPSLFQSPTIRMLTITGAVMAVSAVVTVLAIDGVASRGLPQVAFTKSDGTVISFGGPVNSVKSATKGPDMTSVSSINRVTIDPCTGKQK
jgi:hypothetical protein